MRKTLDALYLAAMIGAVIAMVAIAVLVFVQIAGRITDRILLSLGAEAVGITVPSLAEIGGFLFVASAFLALPTTLRSGAHVRVTVLTSHVPQAVQRVLMILVLGMAFALAAAGAWHSGVQTLDSWRFASVSFGMIRIPLWIPQAAMSVGLVIFAIAVLDEFLTALSGRDPAYLRAEAAKSIDAGGGH